MCVANRKEIVKNVLDSFFESNIPLGSYDDSFVGLMLDEDDKEILTNAITEALEKADENKN